MTDAPASLLLYAPSVPLAQKVLSLFRTRPSLRHIVAQDLSRAFKIQYPTLTFTSHSPVLLSPVYHPDEIDGTNSRADTVSSSVVDELINRAISARWVDYGHGQIITQAPVRHPIHAAVVPNTVLQDTINARAPLLTQICRQALVDYWSEPVGTHLSRLNAFAELLKQALKDTALHQRDLTPQQRQMINEVITQPDKNTRTPGTGTQACIVDMWGEAGGKKQEQLRGLVLIQRRDTVETILLFTLGAGLQVFDSQARLGQFLRTRLTGLAPGQAMQWHLEAPDGDVFEHFAMTFLDTQLADLDTAVSWVRATDGAGASLLSSVHRVVSADFDGLYLSPASRLVRLRAALPAWLKHAGTDERMAFSQYFHELGQLLKRPGARAFDDGVEPILDFARKALEQRMVARYGASVRPDDVEVTVHSVRGTSAAGGFPFRTITTLLKVSLENLASLPGERIDLRMLDGTALPAWMTVSAIKTLVNDVDIGQTYPDAVRATLKDDAKEASWRRARFAEQLRIELPMLALEQWIRRRAGFSRRGYDMVAAVMKTVASERQVDGQDIVLRPLAFQVSSVSAADPVMNMFVIGPKDVNVGPHLLYRPMSAVKLLEFATRQELFDAIAHPGMLQQQVLGWMTDEARTVYRNAGFSAPHFSSLDGLEMLISAWTSRPATLGLETVTGDYAEQLYDSYVQATLELAEKQSVSNAERRSARRMEALSLGLNTVMPFVTGTVSVVGWLMLAWGVHEQIDAVNSGSSRETPASMAGFFLNIALVLMHYSSVSVQPDHPMSVIDALEESREPAHADTAQAAEPESSVAVSPADQPVVQLTESSVARYGQLDARWSQATHVLTQAQAAQLKTFVVTRPATARREASGPTKGLFRDQAQLYAEVAAHGYKVSVTDGEVRVVHPTDAGRPGPKLKTDDAGRWSLDLRLQLRGGLSDVLTQEAARNQAKRQALKAEFDRLHREFLHETSINRDSLAKVRAVVGIEPRLNQIDFELAFATVTKAQSQKLLEVLEQRRKVEVVEGYPSLRSSYTAEKIRSLRMQVDLMEQKRQVLYQQLAAPRGTPDVFSVGDTAKQTPTPAFRRELDRIARLHEVAIDTCHEAQAQFEEFYGQAIPGDAHVSRLDVAQWTGKAASSGWQEALLHARTLRCLKAEVQPTDSEMLEALMDISLRCRLKLLSLRELYVSRRFTFEDRARLFNDAVDELSWAQARLAPILHKPAAYLDSLALGELHGLLGRLRAELVQDTIHLFRTHEKLPPRRKLSAEIKTSSHVMIHNEHLGLLVGTREVLSPMNPRFSPGIERVSLVEPFAHRTLASFDRPRGNEQTTWILNDTTPAPFPPPSPSYATASHLIIQARSLRERLAALELNTQVSTRAVRGQLELHAAKMLSLNETLGSGDGVTPPKSKELDSALLKIRADLLSQANQLITDARLAQHRMITARAPTPEGIADLVHDGEVEILEITAPGASASSLGPTLRSFYIQKVAAVGASATARPEILWFAHFHYANAGNSADGLSFLKGHLKTYSGRAGSYERQLRRALDNEQRLIVLRSNIDHDMAGKLFFKR